MATNSKRERQRQVREQKQAAEQRKRVFIKYASIVLGGILALALVFTLLQKLTMAVPDVNEVVAADQTKGFDKASVLLVEYSDFQCPACRIQHETIRKTWTAIRRKVNMVYRHYPLTNIHPFATQAAYYAEAAGKQGKFWEMHDALFDGQPVWSNLQDPTSQFDEYAVALKLDMARLKRDIESDEVKNKVLADIASGRRAGVTGTPTLFLNGERVSNVREPDELIEAIEIARDLQ